MLSQRIGEDKKILSPKPEAFVMRMKKCGVEIFAATASCPNSPEGVV
jgi:hypothetical protein